MFGTTKTRVIVDEKKIDEVLSRSVSAIYPNKELLKEKLFSGKQMRIYMGIDPTATYAHIGHATNYIVLKRLHNLGHKIIILIGDFTAMIGDPSDKNAERKRLSKEEVLGNLKTFKEQIGKIIDFKDKNNPVELRFNSEWLSKLTFEDGVELASHFTVQQMIERDNFQKRIKENKPLYIHEFFYPLMQGYDSVALDVDMEVGGTDQTFNMLAGRTLLKVYKNKEKFVITTTLLEHPVTKEKLMSKSLGTGVGLDEPPNQMFGKIMALPDEALIQLFVDCTYLSMGEIDRIKKELETGENPKNIKIKLAREIAKIYHGEKAATEAEKTFENTFSKREFPNDAQTLTVSKEEKIIDVLVNNKIVESKSEFRRLIEAGAISDYPDKKINNGNEIVGEKERKIKIGKKTFVIIKPN
ncbi:MAG: tyrosine--tRNA ligase [Candidatus Zambryskibacteria bacterium RIFCSPLOWO2_12_FULL_39_16]|uniref:Tyrosine--tRNA ligase n=1 Tax=Candidatus Zambryskibacteria bacterium RIFCSPLOWO2_12_FULL_39_16 TaxID=1802775 RepID=A0A1G2UR93_9BACT|nr:MAG: tyrosine--tRNA ligase [Candidatus Zambryskibacteria bacterium RIFCSPLOWO2_12_FULL_39_16]